MSIRKRETRAGNTTGREIALALSSFPSLLVSGTQTTNGTVYYAVQSGFDFEFVDEILKCDHSNESSL